MLDRLVMALGASFLFYLVCAGILVLMAKSNNQAAMVFALVFGVGYFTGIRQGSRE